MPAIWNLVIFIVGGIIGFLVGVLKLIWGASIDIKKENKKNYDSQLEEIFKYMKLLTAEMDSLIKDYTQGKSFRDKINKTKSAIEKITSSIYDFNEIKTICNKAFAEAENFAENSDYSIVYYEEQSSHDKQEIENYKRCRDENKEKFSNELNNLKIIIKKNLRRHFLCKQKM